MSDGATRRDGRDDGDPRSHEQLMAKCAEIDRKSTALIAGLKGQAGANMALARRIAALAEELQELQHLPERLTSERDRLRSEVADVDATVTAMLATHERNVRGVDELLTALREMRTGDYLGTELMRQQILEHIARVRRMLGNELNSLVAGRHVADQASALLADESPAS